LAQSQALRFKPVLLKKTCCIYITGKKNNVHITLTTVEGKVQGTFSPGKSLGALKSKRKIFYAGQLTMLHCLRLLRNRFGYKSCFLFLKGVGQAKEGAFRTLRNNKLKIKAIHLMSNLPHNGCRPRALRRI
jgi:small subunit ribosomal protein S11